MNLGELLIAAAVGLVAAIAGGAIGGILTGGKHLGNQIAGMMGAFYGPIGGFHGALIALVAYYLLRRAGG